MSHRSKLNRIELGNRVIGLEDMVALLVVYGVTGLERERLLTLTREAEQPGWWETTGARIPRDLPPLISFESEATRIVHMTTLRVPGLLQTPDYMREVFTSIGAGATEREDMVATRLGRQGVLSRKAAPLYLAIIDEAALRRPFGSPRIMAAQIRHAMDQARRPNIDIRVLPFELGGHTGLDGTYVLMEFRNARPIVHLEHMRSTLYLDQIEDVLPYQEATDTLVGQALSSPESVDFLAQVAADFDQR
jgi:hypothetical protein